MAEKYARWKAEQDAAAGKAPADKLAKEKAEQAAAKLATEKSSQKAEQVAAAAKAAAAGHPFRGHQPFGRSDRSKLTAEEADAENKANADKMVKALVLGRYKLKNRTSVNDGPNLHDAEREIFPPGTEVDVLEIRAMHSDHRVRARIKYEPGPGWISMCCTQGRYVWAELKHAQEELVDNEAAERAAAEKAAADKLAKERAEQASGADRVAAERRARKIAEEMFTVLHLQLPACFSLVDDIEAAKKLDASDTNRTNIQFSRLSHTIARNVLADSPTLGDLEAEYADLAGRWNKGTKPPFCCLEGVKVAINALKFSAIKEEGHVVISVPFFMEFERGSPATKQNPNGEESPIQKFEELLFLCSFSKGMSVDLVFVNDSVAEKKDNKDGGGSVTLFKKALLAYGKEKKIDIEIGGIPKAESPKKAVARTKDEVIEEGDEMEVIETFTPYYPRTKLSKGQTGVVNANHPEDGAMMFTPKGDGMVEVVIKKCDFPKLRKLQKEDSNFFSSFSTSSLPMKSYFSANGRDENFDSFTCLDGQLRVSFTSVEEQATKGSAFETPDAKRTRMENRDADGKLCERKGGAVLSGLEIQLPEAFDDKADRVVRVFMDGDCTIPINAFIGDAAYSILQLGHTAYLADLKHKSTCVSIVGQDGGGGSADTQARVQNRKLFFSGFIVPFLFPELSLKYKYRGTTQLPAKAFRGDINFAKAKLRTVQPNVDLGCLGLLVAYMNAHGGHLDAGATTIRDNIASSTMTSSDLTNEWNKTYGPIFISAVDLCRTLKPNDFAALPSWYTTFIEGMEIKHYSTLFGETSTYEVDALFDTMQNYRNAHDRSVVLDQIKKHLMIIFPEPKVVVEIQGDKYRLVCQTGVSDGPRLADKDIETLPEGTEVEVLEIRVMHADERVRARIKHKQAPAWISVHSTDGKFTWAIQGTSPSNYFLRSPRSTSTATSVLLQQAFDEFEVALETARSEKQYRLEVDGLSKEFEGEPTSLSYLPCCVSRSAYADQHSPRETPKFGRAS